MLFQRFENLPDLAIAAPPEGGDAAPRFEDPRERVRTWERRLDALELEPGARLAVALPDGPDFLAVLLACLRRKVGFVPLNPALESAERERRSETVGAAAVLDKGGLHQREPAGKPSGPVPAVILFTSGSAGSAKAVALSEASLLHVVDTHAAATGLRSLSGTVELRSYLPWSHAFGFTLELLMGSLGGARIACVSPQALVDSLRQRPADWLMTVPRMLQKLEPAALERLSGGIVGGAPVRGALRRKLRGTRLRVGYGQTECAPGATLGLPGEWELDDYLGSPVGCEVRLTSGGELQLKGPNLAMGYVREGRLEPLALDDGWRSTGDLGAQVGSGFVFQGRLDELLKLDNGRMLNPVPLELAYEGAVLLVLGETGEVQPLARGQVPSGFQLPFSHAAPRVMPESFWLACTTPTGKVSRLQAQRLAAGPFKELLT